MSTEARVARLRDRMQNEDLGGLFVTAPAEDIHKTVGANRRYLSGFSGSMGHLLITRSDSTRFSVATSCGRSDSGSDPTAVRSAR